MPETAVAVGKKHYKSGSELAKPSLTIRRTRISQIVLNLCK